MARVAPNAGDMSALLGIKQYTKNTFALVPLLFAGIYTLEAVSTLVAVLAFCLLSSSIYILDDLTDAPRDRLNPKKREQSIASG